MCTIHIDSLNSHANCLRKMSLLPFQGEENLDPKGISE